MADISITPEEIPFPASPVQPTLMDPGREINFRCHRGVACWNACCSNIDISLTPYDILRLKRRTGLNSGDFLLRYTEPYELEKGGIAGVKLKPIEGGTACQFMTPEGCSVYEDRPTACRYYPVALLSMRKQGESTDTQGYALVREPHCLGHNEPRPITIEAYRAEQGVEEYDLHGRGWRQLVLKKKSSGPTVGKPTQRSLQLFFMACYDLDRFRDFVTSASFEDVYELPEDLRQQIRTDDLALMEFGFRLMRQVMFNEDTIPLREGAMERRMQRAQERMAMMDEIVAKVGTLDVTHGDPNDPYIQS